jgi:hypothetical protein
MGSSFGGVGTYFLNIEILNCISDNNYQSRPQTQSYVKVFLSFLVI